MTLLTVISSRYYGGDEENSQSFRRIESTPDPICTQIRYPCALFALGSGDSNPHWFHIAIFPVTAVNPLKIRQYSLRNLLCYRKNCLCETASTCSAEFLQRISVRKGAGGLTPVKADKAEGFVKIQSTGNAGSSPRCLKTIHRIVFLTCKPIGVQFSYISHKKSSHGIITVT